MKAGLNVTSKSQCCGGPYKEDMAYPMILLTQLGSCQLHLCAKRRLRFLDCNIPMRTAFCMRASFSWSMIARAAESSRLLL